MVAAVARLGIAARVGQVLRRHTVETVVDVLHRRRRVRVALDDAPLGVVPHVRLQEFGSAGSRVRRDRTPV